MHPGHDMTRPPLGCGLSRMLCCAPPLHVGVACTPGIYTCTGGVATLGGGVVISGGLEAGDWGSFCLFTTWQPFSETVSACPAHGRLHWWAAGSAGGSVQSRPLQNEYLNHTHTHTNNAHMVLCTTQNYDNNGVQQCINCLKNTPAVNASLPSLAVFLRGGLPSSLSSFLPVLVPVVPRILYTVVLPARNALVTCYLDTHTHTEKMY